MSRLISKTLVLSNSAMEYAHNCLFSGLFLRGPLCYFNFSNRSLLSTSPNIQGCRHTYMRCFRIYFTARMIHTEFDCALKLYLITVSVPLTQKHLSLSLPPAYI